MNTPTELQLRELFAADASRVGEERDLIGGALRKVQHHRRLRTAGFTSLIAAAAAVTAVLASGVSEPLVRRPPVAAPSHPASHVALPSAGGASVPTGKGTLRSGLAAKCVEGYSPVAVAKRSFAFDGTITTIGPARSNRPGVALPLAGVTFRVNKWFRGGTLSTVTIDMEAPDITAEDPLPSYGIGTRLLVSGEPRWGGAPLDAAIAWSCGFTRYYDPGTAAAWAASR